MSAGERLFVTLSGSPAWTRRRAARFIVSRPVATFAAVLFAMAVGWAGLVTWAMAFRDDLVARLISRQAEMQYGYEDRLTAMRLELDKATSRQIINQDSFEDRLAELLRRQSQLESRQVLIESLIRQAGLQRPAADVTVASADGRDRFTEVGVFAPPSQPLQPAGRFGRGATAAGLDTLQARPAKGFSRQPKLPLAERISRADRLMDALEASQIITLDKVSAAARDATTRLRSVIMEVGLNPEKLALPGPREALGGPYVPLRLGQRKGPFETLADRLEISVAALDRLRRAVTALPLERPASDALVTSGYGPRLDPFTRLPALHTGIDFRAGEGAPVHATGAGRVVTAEYVGGYGNMVEIDHGNGIASRYAHLAAVSVAVGQSVTSDTVLGYVGTTGRATGPHLHYETRIAGEPVDPTRFLRAGDRLRAGS